MFEDPRIIALLRTLHYKVDVIVHQLSHIQRELEMAEDKLATLEQSVADNDTVVGSIETLVTNLVAELTAAQGSPNSDVRIQTIIDKLGADKTRLATLVTANTPVDTGEPPPPPADIPPASTPPTDTSPTGAPPSNPPGST
jgi:hypothetical protein